MKQHITIEQYNELSDEAKIKLLKWITSWTKTTNPITLPFQDMTIGRMIEFLEDTVKETGFCRINFAGTPVMRTVEFFHYKFDDFDKVYRRKEICDALWEMVKGVI